MGDVSQHDDTWNGRADDSFASVPADVALGRSALKSAPPDAATSDAGQPGATRAITSVRLAFWVFVAVEAGTFGLWIALGRSGWFSGDEWVFLVDRSAGSPYDLINDHYSHWATVPILVYRALWQVVGLRSYLPYLIVVIGLHLACAAMLRAVMRRAGVDPWIATTAASLFALFGSGRTNIVWAFQIGFTGAVAFGLAYLLFADHDGPVDRRDWFGLVAGLGALMSTSVGVAMVAIVVLAVFVRRGWRAALLHSGTLGTIYLIWWLAIGRAGYNEGVAHGDAGVGELARFVWTGIRSTFGALGQITGVGLVLGVLFVVGLVLAWAPMDLATFRRRAAAPFALGVGAALFLLETGYGRAGYFGPDYAGESRYLHIVAALLLPALAVALDAFVRRWRMLLPVACLLLAIGIPGNIDTLADWTRVRNDSVPGFRHLIFAIPRAEAGREVPGDVRVYTAPSALSNLTVGWLRDAARSGRLPEPSAISDSTEAAIKFRLSLLQSERSDQRPGGCERLGEPVTRHLETGDTLVFYDAGLRVTPPEGTLPQPVQLNISPNAGEQLTAVYSVDLVLQSSNAYFLPTVCPIDRAG